MGGTALGTARVSTTGTVIASGVRVKAIHWRDAGAANGTIVLRDGGATGAIHLTLGTDSNSGEHTITLAPDYIQFDTDVHATLTNVDSLTIFFA